MVPIEMFEGSGLGVQQILSVGDLREDLRALIIRRLGEAAVQMG